MSQIFQLRSFSNNSINRSKVAGAVRKSERHHGESKQTLSSYKGCLIDVSLVHFNLPVARVEVEGAKVHRAAQGIQYIIDPG